MGPVHGMWGLNYILCVKSLFKGEIFCQEGPKPTDIRQRFLFLVERLLLQSFPVFSMEKPIGPQKGSNCVFHRITRILNFQGGGSKLLQGVVAGVLMRIPIETYSTCDFSR